MRHARSLLSVVALAVSVGLPLSGVAQPVESEDRAAARALGKAGVDLYREGRYAEALDRIGRAHAIVGLTTTGLWRGKCLEKLGRLVEAAEQYLEVTRMSPGDEAQDKHLQAIDQARRARQALLPRIPQVRVVVEGSGGATPVVRIDGKEIPSALLGELRPLDPGAHRIVMEHEGRRQEREFRIAESETLELPVAMESSSGPPTPGTSAAPAAGSKDSSGAAAQPPANGPEVSEGSGWLSSVGWMAVGVGAAGLVIGTVTGALALGEQSTLDDGCPGGDCPPDLHDEVDRFEAMRLTSTVSLAAGGVLAAAGVALVLTASIPSETSASTVRLRVGPTGLAVQGRF